MSSTTEMTTTTLELQGEFGNCTSGFLEDECFLECNARLLLIREHQHQEEDWVVDLIPLQSKVKTASSSARTNGRSRGHEVVCSCDAFHVDDARYKLFEGNDDNVKRLCTTDPSNEMYVKGGSSSETFPTVVIMQQSSSGSGVVIEWIPTTSATGEKMMNSSPLTSSDYCMANYRTVSGNPMLGHPPTSTSTTTTPYTFSGWWGIAVGVVIIILLVGFALVGYCGVLRRCCRGIIVDEDNGQKVHSTTARRRRPRTSTLFPPPSPTYPSPQPMPPHQHPDTSTRFKPSTATTPTPIYQRSTSEQPQVVV